MKKVKKIQIKQQVYATNVCFKGGIPLTQVINDYKWFINKVFFIYSIFHCQCRIKYFKYRPQFIYTAHGFKGPVANWICAQIFRIKIWQRHHCNHFTRSWIHQHSHGRLGPICLHCNWQLVIKYGLNTCIQWQLQWVLIFNQIFIMVVLD